MFCLYTAERAQQIAEPRMAGTDSGKAVDVPQYGFLPSNIPECHGIQDERDHGTSERMILTVNRIN